MKPRYIPFAALFVSLVLLTINQAFAISDYRFISAEYIVWIEWIAPLTTFVKDVVVAISAATATFFAYKGVDTWRKELKGKSEYELAKDVLLAVYQVREAFKCVRNPFIMTYEYPEEMTHANGHLKSEKNYEGMQHVYQERWKKMTIAFAALEDKNLEALVEWGSEHQAIINPLRTCRNLLLIAIHDMLGQAKYKDAWETTSRQIQDNKKSILHMYDDPDLDKFTPEINAAIQLFENWLRPHLLHT